MRGSRRVTASFSASLARTSNGIRRSRRFEGWSPDAPLARNPNGEELLTGGGTGRRTVRSLLHRIATTRNQLVRGFGLAWGAAPALTASWLVLLVVQGLIPVAIVYLTRLLVDAVAAAIGGGIAVDNVRPVLLYALLMGATLLLAELVRV